MRNRLLVAIVVVLFFGTDIFAKELTVWHTETDPQTIEAFNILAKRFEAENPGVTVRVVSVGWVDLYNKLTVAIQSGEVPDVTQIEPFMAAYLYRVGELQPIDDVVNEVGKDDIFPAVRDLQLYDGKYYGIATALGISYYSYRKDFLPPNTGADKVSTWNDYLRFIKQPQSDGRKVAPLLLPSNDLHMTLLFTELLASNGGSFFDTSGNPDFTNPRVIETLNYWRELYNLIPADLRSSSYTDNFKHYSQGRALTLPCFFGRGTLQIERSAPEGERSPERFAFQQHPIGPSGNKAYATLDAEPWVILRRAPDPELAKKFLRFFYQKQNYLEFCNSVPIHLTPIFQSLARGPEYTSVPLVQKWRPYYDYQIEMLDKGAVLPIFMARPEDRFVPELFTLEGTAVVPNMIREVTLHGVAPEQAARNAMGKAAQLRQTLPVQMQEKSMKYNSALMWVAGAVVLALITLAALAVLRGRKHNKV
jgi:multiple sugar transport system substrate-binding protein